MCEEESYGPDIKKLFNDTRLIQTNLTRARRIGDADLERNVKFKAAVIDLLKENNFTKNEEFNVAEEEELAAPSFAGLFGDDVQYPVDKLVEYYEDQTPGFKKLYKHIDLAVLFPGRKRSDVLAALDAAWEFYKNLPYEEKQPKTQSSRNGLPPGLRL